MLEERSAKRYDLRLYGLLPCDRALSFDHVGHQLIIAFQKT
jgi:hypothetical protein